MAQKTQKDPRKLHKKDGAGGGGPGEKRAHDCGY